MPLLQTFGNASARGFGFRVGAGAADFELISTQVLGASAASVTFSSIPSGYKHLQLRIVAAADSSFSNQQIRFNGDSGTNYFFHTLNGSGTSVASGGNGGYTIMNGTGWRAGMGINQFFASITDVFDVFSTTKNKTIRNFGGGIWPSGFQDISINSGAWNNTASISSITILPGAGNYIISSRFSLYGVRG